MIWPTTCTSCELFSPERGTMLAILLCECGKTIALCPSCESQREPTRRHMAWRKIEHEEACRTYKDLLIEDQASSTSKTEAAS